VAGLAESIVAAVGAERAEKVASLAEKVQRMTPEEREAERIVAARARTPFDMAHEPLFRVTLVKLGERDHVLVLETHHIVMDGWSLGVLFRELGEAYVAEVAGQAPAFAPLAIQYADFAAWQRGRIAGERLDTLLSFWRAQLEGALEPLELPTDFPRPATPSFAGARHSVLLPPALRDAIDALARRSGATQYLVLLAAYMTVLHRYSGRSAVLVGSGVAGRAEPELAGVVGYVNNTVIQRGDFDGAPTFAELLGRVRERVAAGLDHQEVPLERLALELRDADGRVRSAAPRSAWMRARRSSTSRCSPRIGPRGSRSRWRTAPTCSPPATPSGSSAICAACWKPRWPTSACASGRSC
jgi:non-ribosomal peptide synthetase component F